MADGRAILGARPRSMANKATSDELLRTTYPDTSRTIDPPRPTKDDLAKAKLVSGPATTADRLAFALACGTHSPIACCRLAGIDVINGWDAARAIKDYMAVPEFMANVDWWRQAIFVTTSATDNDKVQAAQLNREWVLARLKRIFGVAMCDVPAKVDVEGKEIYLHLPDLRSGLQALAEMARVLKLMEEEAADAPDDLSKEIAMLRRAMLEGAGKPVN